MLRCLRRAKIGDQIIYRQKREANYAGNQTGIITGTSFVWKVEGYPDGQYLHTLLTVAHPSWYDIIKIIKK